MKYLDSVQLYFKIYKIARFAYKLIKYRYKHWSHKLFYTLIKNEIVLATIFLTTMKFKYLQLVLQSNKIKSSIEYYENIITATTYVNY